MVAAVVIGLGFTMTNTETFLFCSCFVSHVCMPESPVSKFSVLSLSRLDNFLSSFPYVEADNHSNVGSAVFASGARLKSKPSPTILVVFTVYIITGNSRKVRRKS